ncbi:MAG: WYL domain-containing protein, partial [Myxococcota bacterium]
ETLESDDPITLDTLLRRQGRPIPWSIPEPEELPEVISIALEKGLPVQIAYRKAIGEITNRIIEPMLASDRHIVAFCRLRQEQRTFRLDRILSARWPSMPEDASP